MQKIAVIDSGPLIALFDCDDSFYQRATRFLESYDGKLVTTTAVITEVLHLLDFHVSVQLDFLRWVYRGAVELVEIKIEDIEHILLLTEKYSNVPMDFADASLVVVAETRNIKNVVSIDSDFYVYRTLSKGYLQNIFDIKSND